MTGNPYHDETGRFCSRDEMGQAVERLNDQLLHVANFNQYKRVRDQYMALKAELDAATAADPTATDPQAQVAALVQREMAAFMANREFVQAHGVTPQEFASLSEGASQFAGWWQDPDLSLRGYPAELSISYTPYTVEIPADNYYGSRTKVVGGKVNTPVDLKELAEQLYRPQTEVASRAAEAFLRDEGFGNSDAYEIDAHADYYGDRPYIRLADEYQSKAEVFFRQFPNAVDANGLYERARTYGVETKNREPQQAFLAGLQAKYGKKLPAELREQLAKDDKNAYWRSKTRVEITGHGPSSIKVDPQTLAKATAASEVPAKKRNTGKGLPVKEEPVGILLTRDGSNEYELLEGIENYKALVEAPGAKAGKNRKWLTVVMPANTPKRNARNH